MRVETLQVLLIADTHLGFDLPFRPKIKRRRRGHDFFANFQKSLLPALKGEVDLVVHEGDSIDLGSNVSYTFYDVPGHSPCHITLYNEREGMLVIGDTTGFYVPEKDVFWPNYFYSLEAYCNSIR